MNLPIFYDPRQSLKGVNSYSPSADKPERFMDAIPAHFGSPYIQPVVPVTQDDLKLAHHPAYVDGIFNGSILNGFDNNDLRVAESCLWTCGSMLSAARNAVKTGQSACSPTSGFHHAGYADGGGFCTFNGLMVTVAKLTKDNPDVRVGILDCDYHYGDGTADILAHVIHPNVLHRTSVKRFYSPDDTVKAFMDWLYESIDALNAFACDVVLYQAGADMHRMDPLGGLLTDSGMKMRDLTVFSRIEAPIVFNLAGGYREAIGSRKDTVIDTHLATLRCIYRGRTARGFDVHKDHFDDHEAEHRAAFHAWLVTQGFKELTTPEGSYSGSHAQTLWECWEAATLHAKSGGPKS